MKKSKQSTCQYLTVCIKGDLPSRPTLLAPWINNYAHDQLQILHTPASHTAGQLAVVHGANHRKYQFDG